MKFIFFCGLILFSTPTFAEASNICAQQILEHNVSKSLTEAEVSCLLKNSVFLESLEVLCQADMSDFSNGYKNFLYFEDKYLHAFYNYQSSIAQPSANTAEIELRNSRRDWKNLGGQSYYSRYLSLVDKAQDTCEEQ